MIVRKEKNIELLSFPLFSTFKEIENFVTTRNGITEGDNYSAFNLSPYCGDKSRQSKKEPGTIGFCTEYNAGQINNTFSDSREPDILFG